MNVRLCRDLEWLVCSDEDWWTKPASMREVKSWPLRSSMLERVSMLRKLLCKMASVSRGFE